MNRAFQLPSKHISRNTEGGTQKNESPIAWVPYPLFLTPFLNVRNSLDGRLLQSKLTLQLEGIQRSPATLIDPGHKAHCRTTNMYPTQLVSSFKLRQLWNEENNGNRAYAASSNLLQFLNVIVSGVPRMLIVSNIREPFVGPYFGRCQAQKVLISGTRRRGLITEQVKFLMVQMQENQCDNNCKCMSSFTTHSWIYISRLLYL